MEKRIEAPFGPENGFLVKLSRDQQIEPFNVKTFDAHAILVIGRERLQLRTEYSFLYIVRGDVMAIMSPSIGNHRRMDLLLSEQRQILTGDLRSAGQVNMVFSRNASQEAQILRVIKGQSGSLTQQLSVRNSDLYRKDFIEPVLGPNFRYGYTTLLV